VPNNVQNVMVLVILIAILVQPLMQFNLLLLKIHVQNHAQLAIMIIQEFVKNFYFAIQLVMIVKSKLIKINVLPVLSQQWS
jgi:hypothetical protein